MKFRNQVRLWMTINSANSIWLQVKIAKETDLQKVREQNMRYLRQLSFLFGPGLYAMFWTPRHSTLSSDPPHHERNETIYLVNLFFYTKFYCRKSKNHHLSKFSIYPLKLQWKLGQMAIFLLSCIKFRIKWMLTCQMKLISLEISDFWKPSLSIWLQENIEKSKVWQDQVLWSKFSYLTIGQYHTCQCFI